MAEQYDVIVIGSGVSGLGAALYSGRFQLKTLVLGDKPGGTIILTNDVANYPGFNQISGIDLAQKIKEHVRDYDVDFADAKVESVEKCGKCFKVKVKDKIYLAKTVIFSTGSEWRKLNVPGEKEFSGRGVHYCALCDGAFYKNKVVGVVGGSDSAAKEALLLADYASKVYIIARGDKIKPEPINLDRVKKNKKIEVMTKTNIKEIKGEKVVGSVMLDKEYNGSKEFKLDGLFIDIGHIPLSELAKGLDVKLNERGEIIIDRDSKTNVLGVYAAGDVVNTRFKQAITGVAEGVTAAYSAYHYITGNEIECKCFGNN